MCKTMNELEKVVAEYRSMSTLLDEITATVEDLKREIIGYLDSNNKITETGSNFTVKVSTCERRTVDTKNLRLTLEALQSIRELASTEDYTLNRLGSNPLPTNNEREVNIMKEYTLRNRRTNEIITLKRYDLTAGQMKEIWRDGYEIIAIK